MTSGGDVVTPSTWLPTDGFPGLVEIRTTGGKNLEEALAQVYSELFKFNKRSIFSFKITEHKFSAIARQKLRQVGAVTAKQPVKVRNVYVRSPRLVGNRTLASFQINISDLRSAARSRTVGTEALYWPATYNILAVEGIVKALDKEFAVEIKASGRQPGMYALKDGIRLEYRSLPCSVFTGEYNADTTLITRIEKALSTV